MERPVAEMRKQDNHVEYLCQHLYQLQQQQKLCDVVVSIGDLHVQAHSVILAASSSYLHSVLDTEGLLMGPRKLSIQGITMGSLTEVIKFMYTGDLSLTFANVDEVYYLCERLCLPGAVQLCEEFYQSSGKLRDQSEADPFNLQIEVSSLSQQEGHSTDSQQDDRYQPDLYDCLSPQHQNGAPSRPPVDGPVDLKSEPQTDEAPKSNEPQPDDDYDHDEPMDSSGGEEPENLTTGEDQSVIGKTQTKIWTQKRQPGTRAPRKPETPRMLPGAPTTDHPMTPEQTLQWYQSLIMADPTAWLQAFYNQHFGGGSFDLLRLRNAILHQHDQGNGETTATPGRYNLRQRDSTKQDAAAKNAAAQSKEQDIEDSSEQEEVKEKKKSTTTSPRSGGARGGGRRKRGRKTTGRNKPTCPLCNKAFYKKSYRDAHLCSKHGIIPENSKVYKCEEPNCTYKTLRKDSLMNHKATHDDHRPFICDHCGNGFKTQTGLTQHMFTHDKKRFKCKECEQVFSTKACLDLHRKRVHEHNKDMLCTMCPYTTYTASVLHHHMFTQHGVPMPDGYVCHKCEYCDYATTIKRDMNKHMRRHKGERPFSCPQCDRKFSTRNELTNHKRWHGERNFKCVYEGCKYATISDYRLNLHVRTQHTHKNVKPWVCQICDYRSSCKGNFDKHLRNVHKLEVRTMQRRVARIPAAMAASAAEAAMKENSGTQDMDTSTDVQPRVESSLAEHQHPKPVDPAVGQRSIQQAMLPDNAQNVLSHSNGTEEQKSSEVPTEVDRQPEQGGQVGSFSGLNSQRLVSEPSQRMEQHLSGGGHFSGVAGLPLMGERSAIVENPHIFPGMSAHYPSMDSHHMSGATYPHMDNQHFRMSYPSMDNQHFRGGLYPNIEAPAVPNRHFPSMDNEHYRNSPYSSLQSQASHASGVQEH